MKPFVCVVLALALVAGVSLAQPPSQAPEPAKPEAVTVQAVPVDETPTVYEARSWPYIDTGLEGLSARLLKAHYGLYKGYVKKINEVSEKLQHADRTNANYSYDYYSELKRREAVPLMGTYLHELYFDNLQPTPLDQNSSLAQDLKKDFGSLERWWEDAKAVCLSTVGWCAACYNLRDRKLHNYLIEEHHRGFPAFQAPIVIIDSWEHAFNLDYGTARPKYLEAFHQNLNWKVCVERYQKAIRD
jgi:Fe-Mn family superoxide dismutase